MPKNELKADIRMMLSQLTSFIPDGDSNYYQSLISNIYNELDNYSLVDTFVIRQALTDSLNKIIADKQVEEKSKKVAVKADEVKYTNIKVITDPEGGFFVTGMANGKEEVLFKTDNEQKANDYVSAISSTVVAADETAVETPEDTSANKSEDLSTLPSETQADPNAKPTNEEKDKVEEEQATQLDNYNNAITNGNNVLSYISVAINQVPDLSSVIDLAEVKASISDKVTELQKMSPDDANLDDKIEDLNNYLSNIDKSTVDILRKYSPDYKEPVAAETEVVESADLPEDQTDKEETEENSEDTEKTEDISEENTEVPETDTEANEDASEEVNAAADDFSDENTEATTDLPETEQPTDEVPAEEAMPDVDTNTEADADEEIEKEKQDSSYLDEINKMVDELTRLVNVDGDKAEEFAEKVDEIKEKVEEVATSENKEINEEETEQEQEVEPEQETELAPTEETDSEQSEDDTDFSDIDNEIEQQIAPKADEVKEDLMDGVEAPVEKPEEDKETEDNQIAEAEKKQDANIVEAGKKVKMAAKKNKKPEAVVADGDEDNKEAEKPEEKVAGDRYFFVKFSVNDENNKAVEKSVIVKAKNKTNAVRKAKENFTTGWGFKLDDNEYKVSNPFDDIKDYNRRYIKNRLDIVE